MREGKSEEASDLQIYLLDFITTWQQPQVSNIIDGPDITWILDFLNNFQQPHLES